MSWGAGVRCSRPPVDTPAPKPRCCLSRSGGSSMSRCAGWCMRLTPRRLSSSAIPPRCSAWDSRQRKFGSRPNLQAQSAFLGASWVYGPDCKPQRAFRGQPPQAALRPRSRKARRPLSLPSGLGAAFFQN